MNQPIITVADLSKAYRIGCTSEKHDTLVATAASWLKAPFRNLQNLANLNTSKLSPKDENSVGIHWALRDISFSVETGEVIGIIGRNGAGKSTLLKLLSRITDPTKGRALIRGRVASLLEVGTGFHPELTGRDNVYMNGTILGMKKREIDRKFDEILAFSGVEKFIDTPIKRYSSGMKVRLAFAVAANLEPEILIIDEVLTVGDHEFQEKCLGKMRNVARSGRTILFVSHNMAAVEGLCTRGITLADGKLIVDGTVDDALKSYYRASAEASGGDIDLTNHPFRTIDRDRSFQSFRIRDNTGQLTATIPVGQEMTLEIRLSKPEIEGDLAVGIHFYDQFSRRVATCHTSHQFSSPIRPKGEIVLRCRIPEIWLTPSEYTVVLGLAVGRDQVDRIEPAGTISIMPRDLFGTGRLPPATDGVLMINASWDLIHG
jgi:lipopolysaccharide transport system ATP-binding protein